jgi:DMSO/TMAO reductase YedYZ molybdopterin-dependent catalytic subunit
VTVAIHCVTRWSKLATRWKGVSDDTLLESVVTDAEAFVGLVLYRLDVNVRRRPMVGE